MNIYNIMPGDWAARKNAPQDKLKVFDSLGYRNMVHGEIRGFGATETAENLEPIPLTKEILLNNGFEEFYGGGFIIKELSDDEMPTLYIWDIITESLCIVDYYSTNKYTYIKECKYVHEFQHELKSCGIEKEIAL